MAEKYVRFLIQYAVPKGNDFPGDTASKADPALQLLMEFITTEKWFLIDT